MWVRDALSLTELQNSLVVLLSYDLVLRPSITIPQFLLGEPFLFKSIGV